MVALTHVGQAIATHGDKPDVREVFVDHEGKKQININVGASLSGSISGWLLKQFAEGVKNNIKLPNYVETCQADFSSATETQLIISQIMLMSSVKKYIGFGIFTR